MSRSTFKKGNKGSCEGIIPFYTKEAFPSLSKKKNEDSSSDEEGSKRIKAKTMKVQLKLDASKDCKDGNAFAFHLKQIEQLNNNVKTILEVMETIKVNILSQNEYSDEVKKLAAEQQYFKAACVGDAVTQFSEAKRLASLEVFKFYADEEDDSNSNDSTVLSDDAKVTKKEASKLAANDILWFEWVSNKINCSNKELNFFNIKLRETYIISVLAWYCYKVSNHLARKIFSEKYHQAYKKQRDYLFHYICKPMGASVTESFKRLEVLLKYLKYFPPPTQRDEMPRTAVYNVHKKKLPHHHEREAYFNMLLEVAFQEKLERDQEKDYLALMHTEFKTCCIRLEEQDKKDREAKQKARQAAKRGSKKLTSHADQNKNEKAHKRQKNNQVTPQGKARWCQLCKVNGRPKQVYKTQTIDNCCYRLKMVKLESGDFASKNKARNEYKKEMKSMKKKMNELAKLQKELKLHSKRKKSDESSTSSSSDSDISH